MSILDVLTFPDPRLKQKSLPVKIVNQDLEKFVQDLLETMYEKRGIGLAAPQVGRLERVVVIDTRPRFKRGQNENSEQADKDQEEQEETELESKVKQPLILINPNIVFKKGETTYEEGCLSVPSYYEVVSRAEYVEVETLNFAGEKVLVKTDGLLAICIQHEIDHLDGKLFIDRLSFVKSTRIKNKIKKFGYPNASDDDDKSQCEELIDESEVKL